ncbi:MAG: Nramp family divalent metal transporter [Hyphomicrobiales bacterium]
MKEDAPSIALQREESSIPEVFRTIPVPRTGSFLRRFLAFLGPGYLVATGYMDPGNWATAIAGGSAFGYTLLSVALISNIMAILLQSLCARLGLGANLDLAQACRREFPRPVAWVLWLLAEAAIIATDLAEVIGTAIGLKLLFGIPLAIGVVITALDVFLILWLQNLGFRWIEAFVMSLLALIFVCFGLQMWLAQPDVAAIVHGFIPSTDIFTNTDMLFVAMGILGATVMPHNLYLHSGIVQTRDVGPSVAARRDAIKLATIDSTVALGTALFVNASILILAAAAFHATGNREVAELGHAHELLAPLLGTSAAATLFALSLLACGLNSTVTATLAGQIVMQGFLDLKLKAWVRRLLTRGVAIIPAAIVTIFYGESATGKLLILSQVVLSMQLPFAVIPLVLFTARRSVMGELVAPKWLTAVTALIALVIVTLNGKLLLDTFVLGTVPLH